MGTLPWAMAGGLLAIILETIYRRSTDGWPIIPAILIGTALTYCVYRNVNGGSSLILAAAAFNLSTIIIRGGVSMWVLKEPLSRGNGAAVLLLLLAVVIGKFWR